MNDILQTRSACAAATVASSAESSNLEPQGRYVARLFDKDGNLKWEDHYDNLVTDVGARAMMDTFLAGSGFTAAWYLGLISSVSYTGIATSDTSASHAGWLEAGGNNAPAYVAANRPSTAWSISSGAGAGSRIKPMSSAISFTFTSPGTIKGSFLINAAAKDNAGGTLFSAGLFSGGDRIVAANDVLQVSYQLSM